MTSGIQSGGDHGGGAATSDAGAIRSEEHTSELQSHVISYAVFCLKKKKTIYQIKSHSPGHSNIGRTLQNQRIKTQQFDNRSPIPPTPRPSTISTPTPCHHTIPETSL